MRRSHAIAIGRTASSAKTPRTGSGANRLMGQASGTPRRTTFSSSRMIARARSCIAAVRPGRSVGTAAACADYAVPAAARADDRDGRHAACRTQPVGAEHHPPPAVRRRAGPRCLHREGRSDDGTVYASPSSAASSAASATARRRAVRPTSAFPARRPPTARRARCLPAGPGPAAAAPARPRPAKDRRDMDEMTRRDHAARLAAEAKRDHDA